VAAIEGILALLDDDELASVTDRERRHRMSLFRLASLVLVSVAAGLLAARCAS
jgi:hypothetical protein